MVSPGDRAPEHDGAPVRADYPRTPTSQATSRELGAEERIEEALLRLLVHAANRVRHLDVREAAAGGFSSRRLRRRRAAAILQTRAELDHPAPLRWPPTIRDEIHDHLLHWPGSLDAPRPPGESNIIVTVLGIAVERFVFCPHQVVQIDVATTIDPARVTTHAASDPLLVA